MRRFITYVASSAAVVGCGAGAFRSRIQDSRLARSAGVHSRWTDGLLRTASPRRTTAATRFGSRNTVPMSPSPVCAFPRTRRHAHEFTGPLV